MVWLFVVAVVVALVAVELSERKSAAARLESWQHLFSLEAQTLQQQLWEHSVGPDSAPERLRKGSTGVKFVCSRNGLELNS